MLVSESVQIRDDGAVGAGAVDGCRGSLRGPRLAFTGRSPGSASTWRTRAGSSRWRRVRLGARGDRYSGRVTCWDPRCPGAPRWPRGFRSRWRPGLDALGLLLPQEACEPALDALHVAPLPQALDLDEHPPARQQEPVDIHESADRAKVVCDDHHVLVLRQARRVVLAGGRDLNRNLPVRIENPDPREVLWVAGHAVLGAPMLPLAGLVLGMREDGDQLIGLVPDVIPLDPVVLDGAVVDVAGQ